MNLIMSNKILQEEKKMSICWCSDDTCVHNKDGHVCGTDPTLEVRGDTRKGCAVVCTTYKDNREEEE